MALAREKRRCDGDCIIKTNAVVPSATAPPPTAPAGRAPLLKGQLAKRAVAARCDTNMNISRCCLESTDKSKSIIML